MAKCLFCGAEQQLADVMSAPAKPVHTASGRAIVGTLYYCKDRAACAARRPEGAPEPVYPGHAISKAESEVTQPSEPAIEQPEETQSTLTHFLFNEPHYAAPVPPDDAWASFAETPGESVAQPNNETEAPEATHEQIDRTP